MEPDDFQKLVTDTAERLGEHFESVVIVATNQDGDSVRKFLGCSGNWYACWASAREQVLTWDAQTTIQVALDDEDDDS